MKNIKFWAETEEDTENFFNCLRAMNIQDDLSWTDSAYIKEAQKYGIGWCLNDEGSVTYYSDKDMFDEDNYYKEFFFPVPMHDFVEQKPHSHYYKDVSNLQFVDVYRTLSLFNVTDPCLQHAIKKLLVAGGRGAGKDIAQDVQEAVDSLQRWKEMKEEDK